MNKIFERNPSVVLSFSIRVSGVGKQRAPPSLSSKPRIAHVEMAVTLQSHCKKEVCPVIQFLLAKGLNPLDIHLWCMMRACAKFKSTSE